MRQAEICVDNCQKHEIARAEKKDKWERIEVPIGNHSQSSGMFSLAERREISGPSWCKNKIVAVGGDYLESDSQSGTAAYTHDGGKTWSAPQTPPHGYRSAVAYDSQTKTWITVGPNGTDISTDDGRNWRALHPNPAFHEPSDSDKNWNALSLPFVVGPHGRIGKLNVQSLAH